MKDALISKILEPLWIVYNDLDDYERVPLMRAIATVKKDLEIFIGDSLEPE